MNAKRTISSKQLRMGIDIAMVLLLPLLMAYSLIGETFHEAAGTAMFALFLLHHYMNRKWYSAVSKGRYSRERVFRTVLNGLLFVIMLCLPVSGILMSKHLYTFLPAAGFTSLSRAVHLLLAYWGFVLLSIHAGTHMAGVLLRNRVSITASGLIAVYGLSAFVARQFPVYMFGRSAFVFFDFSEPLVWFLLDYFAIMAAWMLIGALLIRLLRDREKTA